MFNAPPIPKTSSSSAVDPATRDPSISLGKKKEGESVPPPPPLMPRPPPEYIQATQEQDTRLRQESEALDSPLHDAKPQIDYSLSVRPMSPLDLGFDSLGLWSRTNGEDIPKPPLPPKVPVD